MGTMSGNQDVCLNLGKVFMLELEIAPRAVADRLKSGETGLILLDVREPWEVATHKSPVRS